MKPKNIGLEASGCYDVEPRTGKPFSSIKIQRNGWLKEENQSMKLDSQVPYTNPRKEFGSSDWPINKPAGKANSNPVEEFNNTIVKKEKSKYIGQ